MADSSPDPRHRAFAGEVGVAALAALAVFAASAAIDAWLAFEPVFVKYNLAAQQVLDGVLPPVRRMDLSPLYLDLAVWVERSSPQGVLALDAMARLHRMVLAATAGLVYLAFARRLPRGIALLGVALFALAPQILVYSRVFEPELFLVFFLLGFIVAVDRESAWAAGLFAACAIATRPTFLPLFPLLGPLCFSLRGDRGRLLGARSLVFLIPVVLCGIALGMRAASITGDPSTPVMNPGTVFFEGNHPLSRGTSAAYPVSVASLEILDPKFPDDAHNRYREVAREALRHSVTIRDVNAFWAHKALAFMVDEPLRAVRNLAGKALRIASDDRWHDTGVANDLDIALKIPRGWFGLLLALGGVGAIVGAKHWRRDFAFYVFALAQSAVMVVFYVSARQQVALIPSLVFFAVTAVHEARLRGWWALTWSPLLAALLFLSLWRDDVALDREHGLEGEQVARAVKEEIAAARKTEVNPWQPERVARMLAANSWLARDFQPGNVPQEPVTLVARAARILRAKPERSFFDEFDLATLELAAGERASALARFVELATTGRLPDRGYWEASNPEFYVGRISALEGRTQEAIAYLEHALRTTPGDPFVLAELAVLDGDPRWRKRIERYESGADASILIGESLLVHGRAREAVAELSELVKRFPRIHRGNVALAVALGRAGDIEEGVAVYERSLEVQSTPLIWSDGVVELYRTWAQGHPDDTGVQLEAARVLSFHGRFHEALARLLSLESERDDVDAAIVNLRAKLAEFSGARAR